MEDPPKEWIDIIPLKTVVAKGLNGRRHTPF
jgi:hypothetical protein